MKVFKSYGSKERLFEMFQKVNNVSLLKENINVTTDSQLLTTAFNKLKSGELNNRISAHTITENNKTIINIVARDNDNNKYDFTFNVDIETGIDDETVTIKDTKLENFKYNDTTTVDQKVIDNFNSTYSSDLFDVVEKYFNAKTE